MRSKRKLPDLNKKVFPYDLVLAYWEDITSDSSWVDINDIKNLQLPYVAQLDG